MLSQNLIEMWGYCAEGLVETNPEGALTGFAEVVQMETEKEECLRNMDQSRGGGAGSRVEKRGYEGRVDDEDDDQFWLWTWNIIFKHYDFNWLRNETGQSSSFTIIYKYFF
ncbi:hypothetical protein LXL04_001231 [Taraxacum kok-saghyz]